MEAPAAIEFYDSRAPLTERRAKLDRRLAGIVSEFAVQWELNRVDGALSQLQSGSEAYWGLSDRVPAPEAHRPSTAFRALDTRGCPAIIGSKPPRRAR
jgi:hypothetical protein